MTQDEAVTHWQERAQIELKAAKVLFEQYDSRLYGEVIFHCHLSLELAMKAAFIQEQEKAAPFTHNLGELASLLSLDWTSEEQDDFDQLSDSAVLARYGDARWFAEKATKENAEMWLQKVESFLSRLLP